MRSAAIKMEEEEHVCQESLNWVCPDYCRLLFRGSGERGGQRGGKPVKVKVIPDKLVVLLSRDM